MKLLVPGVPIALGVFLPATEPFQAVAHVGDLIFVDFSEEIG